MREVHFSQKTHQMAMLSFARSRKFLSLTGLGIAFVLAVLAAGSVLDDPRDSPTSALASMEPHALSAILLRVP